MWFLLHLSETTLKLRTRYVGHLLRNENESTKVVTWKYNFKILSEVSLQVRSQEKAETKQRVNVSPTNAASSGELRERGNTQKRARLAQPGSSPDCHWFCTFSALSIYHAFHPFPLLLLRRSIPRQTKYFPWNNASILYSECAQCRTNFLIKHPELFWALRHFLNLQKVQMFSSCVKTAWQESIPAAHQSSTNLPTALQTQQ